MGLGASEFSGATILWCARREPPHEVVGRAGGELQFAAKKFVGGPPNRGGDRWGAGPLGSTPVVPAVPFPFDPTVDAGLIAAMAAFVFSASRHQIRTTNAIA